MNQKKIMINIKINCIVTKINNLLKEKYYTGNENFRGNVEIFIDPSPRELREIADLGDNYVRFMLNYDTKHLYAWDTNFLHEDVIGILEKSDAIPTKNIYFNPSKYQYCFSYGELIGGKIRINRTDSRYYDDKNLKYAKMAIDELDDDWNKKWFVTPPLEVLQTLYDVRIKVYKGN
jgi:hypothetical protein